MNEEVEKAISDATINLLDPKLTDQQYAERKKRVEEIKGIASAESPQPQRLVQG